MEDEHGPNEMEIHGNVVEIYGNSFTFNAE